MRPEVNWMLIAVDSWPYIRGTLSPSPPGARRVRGPKSYIPTYTPLCSATTTTVPPSERPPLPFGTDVSFPLLGTLASHKRARARALRSLSFFRQTGFVLFLLPRVLALAMSDFFFSHIFADTLTALRSYAILSLRHDGHTDRPSRRGASLSVRNRRRNISIVSACLSQFADERYID